MVNVPRFGRAYARIRRGLNFAEGTLMTQKYSSFRIFRNFAIAAVFALLLLGATSTSVRAHEPIVGLWQATWTDADTNDVVLNLWDAWHSDHTEIQNDSTDVIKGFVCQGAWTSLGRRTYGLTHPSFNYVGANGQLDKTSVGLISEKVTVSKDGKTFAGPGIIKVLSGIDPFDPSATVLFTENINISAKRVTVDTSQLP